MLRMWHGNWSIGNVTIVADLALLYGLIFLAFRLIYFPPAA